MNASCTNEARSILYAQNTPFEVNVYLDFLKYQLFFNASSKATSEGEKLIFLVNAQASMPPNTLSMPLSSHSIESGPSYPI